MNTLWHTAMSYIWAVLVVLGFVFAAVMWIILAVWDTLRGISRRIFGESNASADGDIMKWKER